jgi:hypothetical protein
LWFLSSMLLPLLPVPVKLSPAAQTAARTTPRLQARLLPTARTVQRPLAQLHPPVPMQRATLSCAHLVLV